MKKSIKKSMIAFALCAMSVFSVVASGCGLTDKIGSKIDQMTCEHVWDKGKETKKATCKEEGEFVKTCTLCEKEDVKKLEKIAHTEVKISAVAPTCTLPGLTEGKKCAVCGEVFVKQEEVKALGHKAVTDEAVAPTCTEKGKTEGSHCERCGEVLAAQDEVAATGHSMKEIAGYAATCEATGYTGGTKCQNCDEVENGEIIAVLGHDWTEWNVTAATCMEDGVQTRSCTREGCGKEESEVLQATGHSFEGGVCAACGEMEVPYALYEDVKLVYQTYYDADKGMYFGTGFLNNVEFVERINFTSNDEVFDSVKLYNDAATSWTLAYGQNGVYKVVFRTIDDVTGYKCQWSNSKYANMTFSEDQAVSKILYEWVTANAYVDLYCDNGLIGEWIFNETMNMSEELFFDDVDFTIGENSFYRIYSTHDGCIFAVSENATVGVNGYLKIYSAANGWVEDTYRTLNFLENSYATERFYNVVIENAVVASGFTFEVQNVGYVLRAEEGQTWREWIESEYNTAGLEIKEITPTGSNHVPSEAEYIIDWNCGDCYLFSEGGPVRVDDVINPYSEFYAWSNYH